jgi:tetraacyldisaccharide 4'-kinase
MLADEQTNALRIGDEPMQYFMKFPELVVSVAEERMTGIPALLQKRPDIEVILLDDAYQHRSVRAGLNILITDYSRPFYKDHILPFGSLRESRSAAGRASLIIVSKCPPGLSLDEAKGITEKINPLPYQHVYFTTIHYSQPYDFFTREPASLSHRHIILVCGIARPEPLETLLKSKGAELHTLSYPDHHYFVSSDLEEIKTTFDNWKVNDKVIVTTEKDAARLQLYFAKLKELDIPIFIMPITVEVLFGQGPLLNEAVMQYVEKTIAENNEYPTY